MVERKEVEIGNEGLETKKIRNWGRKGRMAGMIGREEGRKDNGGKREGERERLRRWEKKKCREFYDPLELL